MRSIFSGYYFPQESEFKELWENALIVVDTNVLLDLYKVPKSTRDEILALLGELQSRLWVPYHVALEFQRARIRVIANERNGVNKALTGTGESIEDVISTLAKLELDKRGVGVASAPLIEDLRKVHADIKRALNSVQESQLDVGHDDSLRTSIDAVLEGRVGPSPADQGALDALVADGEERYKNRVPPGFEDADKDRDPTQAMFVADGLRYIRKFGDLIAWRQLIEHVKSKGIKHVLFVTGEKKSDWWLKEDKRMIAPLPELVSEIRRLGGAELFWMYTFSAFIERANEHVRANVSKQSIKEVKEVAARESLSSLTDDGLSDYITHNFITRIVPTKSVVGSGRIGRTDEVNAVKSWLEGHGLSVARDSYRFDLVVHRGSGDPVGVVIVVIRSMGSLAVKMQLAQLETRMRVLASIGNASVENVAVVIAVAEDVDGGIYDHALISEALSSSAGFSGGFAVGKVVNGEFSPVLDGLTERLG